MEYMNMPNTGHQASYFVPQYNNTTSPTQHQEPQLQNPQGYLYQYTNELLMLAQMHHVQTQDGSSESSSSKQEHTKPRLAKDEVDLLETEFQKNHKPSSARKREIAELLKVDLPRINNWFQNRRAKEKGIKKTREFAARQAAERAQKSEQFEPGSTTSTTTATGSFPTRDDHTSLQPSSAPFTNEPTSTPMIKLENTTTPPCLPTSSMTPTMHENEIKPQVEQSSPPTIRVRPDEYSGDSGEYPSPKSLPFQNIEPPTDYGFTPLASSFLPAQPHHDDYHNDFSRSNSISDVAPDQSVHRSLSISTLASPHSQDPMAFAQQQFPTTMSPDAILAPTPSFPSQLLGRFDFRDLNTNRSNLELNGAHVQSPTEMTPVLAEEPSPLSLPMSPPTPTDLRFKSPPPPSNIASRRNKGVPAQLNATALRGYGPKTGLDLSKRTDCPSPIRRIASAAGNMPGRVQKSLTVGGTSNGPRSPLYLERTKGVLMRSLQTRIRSPAQINTSLSPMTPNEYFESPTAQGCKEPAVASSASDDDHRYMLGNDAGLPQGAAAAALFTTLKTPPGTPGLNCGFPSGQQQLPPAHHINSFEAAWSFNPTDEPLVTPGLGSFGSEEFAMAHSVPSYLGGSSQPATPSFPQPYGGGYPWSATSVFSGTVGGMNTEYTFPDSFATGPSAQSSPGPLSQLTSKQFQFTQNMTPQDYNEVEK